MPVGLTIRPSWDLPNESGGWPREEDRRCGGPSRVFRRLSELAAGLEAVAAGSGSVGSGRGVDQWGAGGDSGRSFGGGVAGSPTILVDGRDLFPRSTEWSGGLACRLCRTPAGSVGVPGVEDIMTALMEGVINDDDEC